MELFRGLPLSSTEVRCRRDVTDSVRFDFNMADDFLVVNHCRYKIKNTNMAATLRTQLIMYSI